MVATSSPVVMLFTTPVIKLVMKLLLFIKIYGQYWREKRRLITSHFYVVVSSLSSQIINTKDSFNFIFPKISSPGPALVSRPLNH